MERLNVPLVGKWKLHVICRGWAFWRWRLWINRNTLVTVDWVVREALRIFINKPLTGASAAPQEHRDD